MHSSTVLGLWLIFSGCLMNICFGEDSEYGFVTELTERDFDSWIVGGKRFVWFYVPWSIFDKRMMSVWDDVAKELTEDGIALAKMNVDEIEGPQFIEIWDIRGFPTIALFVNGEYFKYDQLAPRTTDLFVEFARGGFRDTFALAMFDYDEFNIFRTRGFSDLEGIPDLTDENFHLRTMDGEWFVLFYAEWCDKCKEIEADVWPALYEELKGEVKLAKLDGARHDLTSGRYGVKGFPQLLRITNNGDDFYKYSSKDVSKEKLLEFALKGYKQEETRQPLPDMRPSDVVVLNDDNFDEITSVVDGSGGPWLIEFYAPWCGHCKKLIPLWEEVGTVLKGQVKVGKMDAVANKRTSKRFRISGIPTIILFTDGLFRMYESARRLSVIVSFATGNYRQIKQAYQVPPALEGVNEPEGDDVQRKPPTDVKEEIKEAIGSTTSKLKSAYEMLLRDTKRYPNLKYILMFGGGLAIAIILLPLLFCCGICQNLAGRFMGVSNKPSTPSRPSKDTEGKEKPKSKKKKKKKKKKPKAE